MCGIVGMLLRRGDARSWHSTIRSATNMMARRGPDSDGFWSDDEACLLGFRRLSILDLAETGNQPMVTPDGRYALVFNGELYNFREIRKSLEARGTTFRSTGDAEVVLHALAQSGAAALASFNGMFALAFYDAHERRLLVARDHAGIKPLYVLRHPDGILFASQFDQVLSHPWARDRSIDPQWLDLYFNLGYLPPPATILEGAIAMEPGTWRTFDSSGLERHDRWFEFPKFPEPDLTGADAFDAVDGAVTAAVGRQLVSDVPVGVLLSGGIDSPLVAAKAQAAFGSDFRLPAFTLGTAGTAEDESADAARYAQALGLRHVVRHITSDDVLGLLDDVVTACSEPMDDFSIFPTAWVSRVAREEVPVVLSGDGGDDIFWGYPPRMITPLVPHAGSTAGRIRRGVDALLGRSSLQNRHDGARQLRIHRMVSRETLGRVLPGVRQSFPDLSLFDFDGGDVDTLARWLRWNEYSGHLLKVLQKVDRASMHASLEVRVPLLDREVLDVAARVDWRACVDIRTGIGKLPLRAALQRHTPFQTIAKRGFAVPMASWLRGPLRPLIDDLLLSRRDLLGVPFDRDALVRVVEAHQSEREESTNLLWRLLSLALWESRHYRRSMTPDRSTAVRIA